jgi:hypothetical protein
MPFIPRVRLWCCLALSAFVASTLAITALSAGDVTGGSAPTNGRRVAGHLSAPGLAARLQALQHLMLTGSASTAEATASQSTPTGAGHASDYRLGSSRCDKRSTLKSGKRSRVLPDTIEWEEPDDEVDDDWDAPLGLCLRYTTCTHVGCIVSFADAVPAFADCPSSLSISSVRLRC